MSAFSDNRNKEAQALMNTLIKGGYLKNFTQEEREEKIVTILG